MGYRYIHLCTLKRTLVFKKKKLIEIQVSNRNHTEQDKFILYGNLRKGLSIAVHKQVRNGLLKCLVQYYAMATGIGIMALE